MTRTQPVTRAAAGSALMLALMLAACDRGTTTAPGVGDPLVTASEIGPLAARAIALAMAEEPIRKQILTDLRDSPYSEHKVVLQDYLRSPSGTQLLAAIARTGIDSGRLNSTLQDVPPIQFYVPADAHRSSWRGTPDILVVPQLTPDAPEVGFAPTGATQHLDLAEGLPAGLGALFILQGAEPMLRRWAGRTAATETIQEVGESQIGSGTAELDAAGRIVRVTDHTREGNGGPQLSHGGSSVPAGTYLRTLINSGVCDNFTCDDLEIYFSAVHSSGDFTSELLTGIDTYATWIGLWKIHNSRATDSDSMRVEVKESDVSSPDDHYLCPLGQTSCSASRDPRLPYWDEFFLVCDVDPNTGQCPANARLEVLFTDRADPVTTTVTVSPATGYTIVGSTPLSLTATARDQYGDVMSGKTATWSSSNTGIATVTSTGNLTANVTGVSQGQATITATIEGKTGTSTVNVYFSGPSPYISGPSQIQHFQSVQYFAQVTGGTPPYHYQWRTRNCTNGICGAWTAYTLIGSQYDRSDHWIGTPSCSVTRIDIEVLVTDANVVTGSFWRDIAVVGGGSCS